MMPAKLLLLIMLMMSISVTGLCQQATIKGRLVDSADNKGTDQALITLMTTTDSTLVDFARADKEGWFQIANLDTGKYYIMITHPYFADFFEDISVQPGQNLDMGIINMLSKLKMLQEVVIKSGAPIRVKGDTIVYTADSFKVKEGANVEELLKKLPGITVDRDGKITAMGQTVKKVLVDGEEFFGSDPGIATKNLRADIVKDVEVYDKKSDQAAFTGIDDGVKEKTINLKIKEDKKNGYFGKIEAGGGLKGKSEGDQHKFNNAAMINAFKGKRKIAAYGIMSNTGTLNLSWDDSQKYGDGGNMQVSDDGGGIMFYTSNEQNSSNGIPTNWNIGLHYSDKFNQDKQGLNLGYKYTKINAPSFRKENSRYFYPNYSYNTNSNVASFSSNIKQNINITYEWKIDSMNTLKVIARGNRGTTSSRYSLYKETFTENYDSFLNKQTSNGITESKNENAYASLLWLHKFKKLYRTISISSDFNYVNSNNDNIYYNNVDFYKNNVVDSNFTIDQNSILINKTNAFNTKVSFTEPLAKDFYMELSYALNSNKNINDRDVFGKAISGKYDQLIDSLSNDYEFNSFSNSPGINFRLNRKKINLSFGTIAGFTNYEQVNQTLNQTTTYNFTNHYPRASFNYKIKQSENLSFYYSGSATAPNLRQLQPIIDLSDPLNIYRGNPDLRPSFRHSFNINYYSFKLLKERNIFGNIGYSFTDNALVTANWLNESVQYSQTRNADGVANLYSYINYGMKLKKANIRLNFGPQVNWYRNINYTGLDSLSLQENVTNSANYGFSIGVNKSKSDKYDFSIRPGINYNVTKSSLNVNSNFKYWSGTIYASGNIDITKSLEINTDFFGNFQQKYNDFGGNANYYKWNAYISQKFYKNQFEARFSVFDILNQNRGYNFNSSTYAFTETYRTILKRFWLLSFIWNINSTGTKPAEK